ncbi:MAG: class I SAM-dependent methyltransferase [Desulfuromonas sp.]|nr:MAG: class I SAM-dependent methyltransferase [Desulfuromonas sp.]
MYSELKQALLRPKTYQFYTAELLWNDPHISGQMLNLHLDKVAEPASRNFAFINSSLDWICDEFQINSEKRVADFGCGPGLYTTPLAQRGAQLTGIDFSERSIAYARKQAAKNNLDIDYRCQNYLDFSTEQKFDLITLIYCDFCALSPEQRKKLLNIMFQSLADNGRILLDVFSLSAYQQREESEGFAHNLMAGFWSAADYYGFQKTVKYDDEKVVLDKYTIVEAGRSFEVYNWLQYFSLKRLTTELNNCGFDIISTHANVAGEPYSDAASEIAVVAEKR